MYIKGETYIETETGQSFTEILDPEEIVIAIVPSFWADGLLSHLNRGQ